MKVKNLKIEIDGLFPILSYQKTLENTEGTISNGQSSEIGNIVYTRRRQTKQKHNTISAEHQYTQTNTNNANKTCALLQTTGNRNGHHHRVNYPNEFKHMEIHL